VDLSVDQDWALVEVGQRRSFHTLSHAPGFLRGISKVPSASPPQENTRIVANTASGGRMTGTLAATSCYACVPCSQSFQRAFSVKLDGPLADGDCSSAVFDAASDEMFDHIVAGCCETGFAHVIAAQSVMPQILLSAERLAIST
jgi:hypothetical protein